MIPEDEIYKLLFMATEGEAGIAELFKLLGLYRSGGSVKKGIESLNVRNK